MFIDERNGAGVVYSGGLSVEAANGARYRDASMSGAVWIGW